MEHQIECSCGRVHFLTEGMAGSTVICTCGRAVLVPSPSEPPAHAIVTSLPPPVPDIRLPDDTPSGRQPAVELISPKQAVLRIERGTEPERRAPVMAALTADAVWIQETWRLREIPLRNLVIERRPNSEEVALTLGSEPASEKLTLTFASAAQADRWCMEAQEKQRQLAPDSPPRDWQPPEGVALVRHAPPVPREILCRVEFTGSSRWAADRGLQLRAGILGADAVVEVYRHKVSGVSGCRHATGLAIRVEDDDARNRLRMKWYAEEVGSLVNRMLLLLLVQVFLLFLASTLLPTKSGLQAATGETREEWLASARLGMGLVFAWPLVMVVLLRVFRWPQLLRAAGLATLVATTGRGLAVWLAHLLAVLTTGAPLTESKLWFLVDPMEWFFVIAGVVLCLRAWRLSGNARQILPEDVQTVPSPRKACSRGLAALTGVYALGLLSFVGTYRYQASAHLLQPGVDPRREHEALLALNEGAAQANRGDLVTAEQSFQRALRLWEDLAAGRSAPPPYRTNLAMTLYNLGWLRQKQGRADEAELYYSRAVAIANESLPGDAEFKEIMAGARQALADLRASKSSKQLDEKDQAAARNYEEAQVKAQKGEPEAERLYQEAITLWEELFPLATNEDYLKTAAVRLATACHSLGELQQQLGKRLAAEATMKKAIAWGEKAVALDPNRPLLRHNLELARRLLEELREQAHHEEVTSLWKAKRFADARGLYLRSIEEQEEQVRSGKDREAAVRRLAYRLNRFAWFLAHCPDEKVRDSKAAIRHARRATELQPDAGDNWYILALVQYRNGDWRDSLASLEKMKDREPELDASSLFLFAMNLHQLKRKAEARAAFRKAGDWIEERKRQAMDSALLRFQFETVRLAIEALQQEAENVLEGKAPADQGDG